MKPFNLERALAGDRVVTRNGLEVIELQYFKKRERFKVLALIEVEVGENGEFKAYNDDGTFCQKMNAHYDLFMAPKVKTYYVNLYRDDELMVTGKICFESEELCLAKRNLDLEYIKTISFELEE